MPGKWIRECLDFQIFWGRLPDSLPVRAFLCSSDVAKGGDIGACPHCRSWKFFKVYYFCCVEFLCILFSRIFSMCLRLLGLRPHTLTGTLPVHGPRWETSVPQTPSFAPSLRSKFLATPLLCSIDTWQICLISVLSMKRLKSVKFKVEYRKQICAVRQSRAS